MEPIETLSGESCVTIDSRELANKLAALSHPTRIEILKHLSATPCCCCGEVVKRLDLAQSTVSQHLKILVEAGFVRFATEKQRSRYEVDTQALAAISAAVAGLVASCCIRD